MVSQKISGTAKLAACSLCLVLTLLLSSQVSTAVQTEPQVIPEDLSCGKCGMYPASYPQWQSEIIFNDGSMSAFDGCKCMFGFMFDMGQYDQSHKNGDIAKIWVRDFNSGEWIDGREAHFVVGSDVMGPMGKELIPFQDQAAADTFQKEHGGELTGFDTITMATLKPLMGKMHMKNGMKMEGKKMEGSMKE